MKKLLMLTLVWAMVSSASCGLAERKAPNGVTANQNRRVYEVYRRYMQSQNQERAMSGLAPLPIKSFEEWQNSPGTK